MDMPATRIEPACECPRNSPAIKDIEQIRPRPIFPIVMSLIRKRILPMLTILVLACAQVFGMQRGYECAHQGTVVATDSEHCHGVAGADKADFVPCAGDSEKSCGEQGETEHHAPLGVEMTASTRGLAAVSVPAFVAALIAEIPVHEWALIHALAGNDTMKTPLDTGGDSPPAAVQVARCVVMLV